MTQQNDLLILQYNDLLTQLEDIYEMLFGDDGINRYTDKECLTYIRQLKNNEAILINL